jgi:hypothetical protein
LGESFFGKVIVDKICSEAFGNSSKVELKSLAFYGDSLLFFIKGQKFDPATATGSSNVFFGWNFLGSSGFAPKMGEGA